MEKCGQKQEKPLKLGVHTVDKPVDSVDNRRCVWWVLLTLISIKGNIKIGFKMISLFEGVKMYPVFIGVRSGYYL